MRFSQTEIHNLNKLLHLSLLYIVYSECGSWESAAVYYFTPYWSLHKYSSYVGLYSLIVCCSAFFVSYIFFCAVDIVVHSHSNPSDLTTC